MHRDDSIIIFYLLISRQIILYHSIALCDATTKDMTWIHFLTWENIYPLINVGCRRGGEFN